MAVTEPAPDEALPPGPLLRLVSDQRVAYLIVGTFNTANAFFIFVVSHLILGDGFWRYMASLVISHVIGVLCAFVLHRRFVFRVRGHVWLDLARFELVNLAALGFNAVLLPLFVEVVGLPVIVAQVVAGGLAVIGTYFAHLLFSFRRPENSQPTAGQPTTSEAVDT
jgi:putative flippase GtrA